MVRIHLFYARKDSYRTVVIRVCIGRGIAVFARRYSQIGLVAGFRFGYRVHDNGVVPRNGEAKRIRIVSVSADGMESYK